MMRNGKNALMYACESKLSNVALNIFDTNHVDINMTDK